MHWLEAGQTCRSGDDDDDDDRGAGSLWRPEPGRQSNRPGPLAPNRFGEPPTGFACARCGRQIVTSIAGVPARRAAGGHRSGSAAGVRPGRRPAAGGAPKCPRTRRCSPTAAAPAPWPAARQRQRHDRARCCGQRRSRHLPASARPPGLPRPGCRGRGVPAVLDAIERRWHTTHQNTKEVSKRGTKRPPSAATRPPTPGGRKPRTGRSDSSECSPDYPGRRQSREHVIPGHRPVTRARERVSE